MTEADAAIDARSLSYLGYCLGQAQGSAVITGSDAALREAAVEALRARIAAPDLAMATIDAEGLAGEAFLRALADGFEVETQGTTDRISLGTIESFLHGKAREGERCLLIVRDAHQLESEALETLQLLAGLSLASRPLLQLLFVGDLTFMDRIGAQHLAALRESIMATHELTASAQAIEPTTSKGVRDVQAALAGLAVVLDGGQRPRRPSPSAARVTDDFSPESDALRKKVVALEARCAELEEIIAQQSVRMDEQERTLRQTLEMLIEWIETGDPQRRSA